MDRIMAGTMTFDQFCREANTNRKETDADGREYLFSPVLAIMGAMSAPLDYSMRGGRTAREILLQDYHVPEWSLTLFALADVARFGAWFQSATDPANMYRRLAHVNADGSYWKGNARATRRDYLGYIDRIIAGKRCKRRYDDPPASLGLAWNGWASAKADAEEEEA